MAQALTYPVILTEGAARKFLRDLDNLDRGHPCVHGHLGCSTYDGGPCLDETLNNFPDLADVYTDEGK